MAFPSFHEDFPAFPQADVSTNKLNSFVADSAQCPPGEHLRNEPEPVRWHAAVDRVAPLSVASRRARARRPAAVRVRHVLPSVLEHLRRHRLLPLQDDQAAVNAAASTEENDCAFDHRRLGGSHRSRRRRHGSVRGRAVDGFLEPVSATYRDGGVGLGPADGRQTDRGAVRRPAGDRRLRRDACQVLLLHLQDALPGLASLADAGRTVDPNRQSELGRRRVASAE